VFRLTVPERVLLFCLASDTDWQKAGVTHATAQHMMVRGLIEREGGAGSYALTAEGRAVLRELLGCALFRSVRPLRRRQRRGRNAHAMEPAAPCFVFAKRASFQWCLGRGDSD